MLFRSIVGGESKQSGHEARLFDLAWARSTIEQCKVAGVPIFVKQLGSFPVETFAKWGDHFPSLIDRAGTDLTEWTEDLRVREFPS